MTRARAVDVHPRGPWRRVPALIALAALLSGCGDSTGPGQDGSDADPALAPFVGDWEASALVIACPGDPEDVLASGAAFTLNVQPSGTYTAILGGPITSFVEIGRLSVVGSTVVLRPTTPPDEPSASDFVFDGPDRLILDGPTEYDCNGDALPEEVPAHIELERR